MAKERLYHWSKLSDGDVEDLIRMTKEGCSRKEIGEYLGITIPAVRARQVKLGLKWKSYAQKFWNNTAEDGTLISKDDTLITMWSAGKSTEEIARTLGTTPKAITYRACALRKKGVHLGRKDPPGGKPGRRWRRHDSGAKISERWSRSTILRGDEKIRIYSPRETATAR